MANGPLVRRLMLAGASPERAQQFAQQYARSVAQKTGSRLPQDLEDAFDKDLAALSEAYFPGVFRPPAVGSKQLGDYISFVFGPQKLSQIENQVYAKNAPAFLKARAAGGYEATLAALIENGASLQQLNKVITDDYNSGALTEAQFPITNPNMAITQSASAYANKLFNQYYNAKGKVETAQSDFLKNDKYYSVGLPHPTLKYGRTTDLKRGIIGVNTLGPKIQEFIAAKVGAAVKDTNLDPSIRSGLGERATSSAYDELLGMINKRKGSPFADEVKRRESLKGKTLLPPRP